MCARLDAQTRLELTAVGDDDGLGSGARAGANSLDGLNDLHTLGHGTEDAMLAIQPGGLDGAQEELGSVGVGAGVGHGKNSGAGVLEGEVLVGELFTVDGLTAGAVAAGEVTTLTHEIVNDTMEGGALEVKGLAALAHALLAGAEAAEIFGGLGDDIRSERHLDTACGLTSDGHVKENNRVRHLER